jgi:acyl carrier protein
MDQILAPQKDLYIKSKLKTFIKDNFLLGYESSLFDDDDSFLEKGIIDSTGVLELVEYIEGTFGISVEDEDLVPDNLDSVNRLACYVQRKITYAA